MQPTDWIVLDPIAPRLAHPHSFVHDLSSEHFASRGGGSLALWSLFTALVGPLGAPLRRMDLAPTSTFMAACNRIGNGFSESSSKAAQLADEGAAQDRVDAARVRAFADNLVSLSASSHLLRLSGSVADSLADRRDAHTTCFQPSQLSEVLLRNFSNVLSQFPALSAIAAPASLGESLSAIDALRVAWMPFARLDFAVMSSFEVGFTAPGGDSARSLLPDLLQASFSSLPVPHRVVAAIELLRNVPAVPASVTAVQGAPHPPPRVVLRVTVIHSHVG